MNTIAPRWQWLSPVLGMGLLLLLPLPGQAQSIQMAPDGTDSNVTQSGANYTIEGGALSRDGANLFHSFSRFGLNTGEVANFLSTPTIQNILGRVTGGEASVINGLIQVTGSNANLFLLNPAGIVFGSNASLSVPASFTATTANAIGFGNGGWFQAVGTNDYATLVGNPQSFAFTIATGTIVNAGNLAVGSGQSLTLLGSRVINTGTLTAPDGTITLAAVPGENLVRLSQANNLLSLEFAPPAPLPTSPPPAPLSLPQLLTGGNVGNATGLTVTADGRVSLTQSGLVIPSMAGTTIATGTLTTAGTTGGAVTVVGDLVTVSNALINAAGTNGGGTVRIGGDYRGQNTLPAATETTLTADSTIRADALTNGNGGRVIVWADETANIHGALSARGGAVAGDGGLIETSGKQVLHLTSLPNAAAPNGAAGTWLIDPINVTIVPGFTGSPAGATLTNGTNTGNTVNAGDINSALNANTNVIITTNQAGTEAGNIVQNAGADITKDQSGSATLTLEAANDIILNSSILATPTILAPGVLTTPVLTLVLNAGRNITTTSFISTQGGNITMTSTSGSINTRNVTSTTASTINSGGGNITMSAPGNITAGNLSTFSFSSTGSVNGNIQLTSTGGAIDVTSASTSAGAIAMTASGNITAGSLSSLGASTNPGGNITLISTNGAINTRSNSTSSLGFVRTLGGTIRLSALGDITTDSLATAATSGPSAGGPITLTSTAGAIDTRRTVTSTSTSTTSTSTSTSTTSTTQNAAITSGGGAITLTAAGNITAGEINASANTAVNGTATNGGNVKITTPGDLLVSQINTQSRAASLGTGTGGTGGTVTIEVGNFVRVSDRFTDQNNISASISSAGGAGGGAISITHGGRGVTPFIVGDAGVNGTAGAITTGTSTILPTQSFLQSTIIGNISILTSTSILASPLPTPPSFGCDLTLCQSPIATAPMPLNVSVPTPQDTLQQIEEATGVVPALIYLSFIPTEVAIVDAWQANESRLTSEISRFVGKPNDRSLLAITTPDSEFELLLVTATGDPIRKRIPGLTRTKMIQVAQQFRNEVANPVKVRTRSYLPTAQRLYDWIIRPLEQELVARKIQNLSFIAETGLRFIPFAALHDGENFLIDKYSLGLMPSLSLVDTRYVNIRNSQVLVGGTSTFTDLPPLPAVPTEMAAISQLWPNGTKVLNDDQFTLKELKAARQQQPFGIIHLATHGEFIANHLGESYIQLSDTRLRLDQLRLLGFNHPPVELMVLSACRMALGDDDAELGFAGLALQAGVKSALASLWNVSDEGTVALMTAFYGGLRQAPIKAEALRQAQLAMRNGQVSIRDGKVVYTDSTGELTFDLPESLRTVDNRNLLHPYYWAAFTMLGSPW